MSHIFISYSRKDEDYAQRLAKKLRTEGLEVWIDQVSIRYGENWEERIYEGVATCGAFIVIMTPASRTAKWVQREVAWAEMTNKPVFPLLLSGDNFPRFVLTQYVDVTDSNLPQLDFYSNLKKLLYKQPPMSVSASKLSDESIHTDGMYYRRFVSTESYSDAGLAIVRYEYIKFFEEGYLIVVESTSPNLSDVIRKMATPTDTERAEFSLSEKFVQFQIQWTTYIAKHSGNRLFVFSSERGGHISQNVDLFEYYFMLGW